MLSLECRMKQKVISVRCRDLKGEGQRGKQMEAINDILGTVESDILWGCLADVYKFPGYDRASSVIHFYKDF